MKNPIKHRLTLDKAFDECTLLPYSGVYILAYMGKVIYVGKAENVSHRLYQHYTTPTLDVDDWLCGMVWDLDNIRLDILETPDDVDEAYWLRETEAACINTFNPVMNMTLSG